MGDHHETRGGSERSRNRLLSESKLPVDKKGKRANSRLEDNFASAVAQDLHLLYPWMYIVVVGGSSGSRTKLRRCSRPPRDRGDDTPTRRL